MTDRFKGKAQGLDAPASRGFSVTPNDSTDLSEVSRALWIGGAGAVSLLFSDSATPVVFSGIAAGTLLPVRAARVRATGTTATAIVALA